MRKIHIKVEVDLFIKVNENQDLQEVIDEMDYSFTDETGGASIEDSNILDWEITDSR